MTNDLVRRVYEHKQKLIDGFTKKYNLDQLLYFEEFNDPRDSISREKQIKDYRRSKKQLLIQKLNPDLRDLYHEIC